MRVIHRESDGSERINCDSCGSTLEFKPEDVMHGRRYDYIECPVCGQATAIEKPCEDDCSGHIPIYPNNSDNDFYFFEGGVPMTDEEINERIKRMCDEWASLDDDDERNNYCSVAGTGDTIVIAIAVDEGEHLEIYVCKNYAEAMFWTKEK